MPNLGELLEGCAFAIIIVLNQHKLSCLPQSICSWDYRVHGASRPVALEFDFFTEQGRVFYGNETFAVVKHGWLSGQWSLENKRGVYAEAHKPSAFFRAFEIDCEDVALGIKARSPFTRCFDLMLLGGPAGSICPDHPFTRRASITCDRSVPELGQLFAFWLAVLTWRRTARNHNHNSAAGQ